MTRTRVQAETLIRHAGASPLTGTATQVAAAAYAECEASARAAGWQGEWTPEPADEEYVAAQLMLLALPNGRTEP